MLAFFSVAVIIYFGGSRVLDNAMTFGVLYAFINYITMLFQPINDLAEKYNILQSSMAASERIFAILDWEEEVNEGQIVNAEDMHGDVEFKNVWFAYNNEDYVLKDVSFRVPAGKTVAIVGATGAGKTSIISLINRFYNINKGSILIDGRELPSINLKSLRSSVGMVLQDVFLFSGDIAKNIRLNDASKSDEHISKVASYVNASTFIENLPGKYSEEVKEGGVTLSTGQRQLLAFARALAFDPKILILDEATANIDTETEQLIQDALSKLTKDRTTIIISHRLSTIQHADNIIVMHKGKIREMGNHNDLLTKKGLYYNLYKLQYKEA
jgi:ABC-type multidrug transport system fused ATPase/permease subunit